MLRGLFVVFCTTDTAESTEEWLIGLIVLYMVRELLVAIVMSALLTKNHYKFLSY